MEMDRPTRRKTRNCAFSVRSWWLTQVSESLGQTQERWFSFIRDLDGAELFNVLMFPRIAQAPALYVTDSSSGSGLGDDLSGRKVMVRTGLVAVRAGIIITDDLAGKELADASCVNALYGG